MAQAGDGGVGAAGAQANGAALQPIVRNASVVVQALNGVAPGARAGAVNVRVIVGNAATAAPAVEPAAAVLAAAPVAAMLAVPVIPNLAVPPVGREPGFDIDAVFPGPLPTKSNFAGYEIYPWVG